MDGKCQGFTRVSSLQLYGKTDTEYIFKNSISEGTSEELIIKIAKSRHTVDSIILTGRNPNAVSAEYIDEVSDSTDATQFINDLAYGITFDGKIFIYCLKQ